MGRTERRFLGSASIACLLALTATTGAADPLSSAPTPERLPVLALSPEAFAQRATVSSGATPSGRNPDSWRNAIELIVLAGTCAIAVAFYSAATTPSTDTQETVRVRRR